MQGRVLIVENDDDQRRLISLLLQGEGFAPVPAWNAEDGLEILKGAPCDLAIFDIQLPGMDGFKALSLVGERLPRLPVILVTASGDVRETEALSLGARGFLRKPFAAEELLDAVGTALSSRDVLPVSDA